MTPQEIEQTLAELTEATATAKRRANYALDAIARVIDNIDNKAELTRIREELR